MTNVADTGGLLDSLAAAVQASLSVLLVIFYGGIAAWMGLLSPASTKAISKVCVRLFLPALLFTKIGAELHTGSAGRYATVLAWAVVCHAASFVVGIAAHLLAGMPDWTTVALMFNNSTSYPLLLIAALDETGILKNLVGADESTSEAVERAKSYFLVFATVSSCLTFAVGPRLIDSEHAPEPEEEDKPSPNASSLSSDAGDADDERSQAGEDTGLLQAGSVNFQNPFHGSHSVKFFPSIRKPSAVPKVRELTERRASIMPRQQWRRLSPRAKWWLLFVSDFFNAPLLGAVAGAVVGLTPVLHTAFFSDTQDGGIFTAWLTASLRSIGGLFVPLPVVVAGVSLFTSMRDARRNSIAESQPKLPWGVVAFVLVLRFVVWPAVSITSIWLLASRTELLGSDPMLWFTLMLMPTGPPAMKLITLVQVSDADEAEETIIAKLLTVSRPHKSNRQALGLLLIRGQISYVISPVLSLTVVGGLKASQACIR
jgi:auxin efflux carrier family protein